MKILYLSVAAIPNDWAHVIQIMKMSEAFGRRVEVEVVVPKRKKTNTSDPFDYYHIERTFKITEIPCIDLSHESPSKFVFFIRLFSFLVSARLIFGNRKDVVVYTREQYASLFFSRVIYELHALPASVRALHLFLWKRVLGWIVLTDQIRQRLIKNGILSENIHVEPDAVDFVKFDLTLSMSQARQQLNLEQNIPIIGYVGTLKTMGMEKGVGIAICALKFLPKDYRLLVVGGEKKDIHFYEGLASEQDVRKKVIFLGKIEHHSVPLYLKACNIVVAPFPDHPHYRYFMSPLKIFEYMAAKRAIITSDLESIREILDETTSVLTSPGNVSELAHAIHRLIESPNTASQLAETAYMRVQNYTWDKRAQRIVDFVTEKARV